MNMDNCETVLPQEGTSRSAGGESLRASEQSEARCPSYSGGGNNCLEEGGGSTSREKDLFVHPERCDSALSLRSTRSSARGYASSGRESPLLLRNTTGRFASRANADAKTRRKRKTVKRPVTSAPSDSSEIEPAPAKFLAVEERTATIAASSAKEQDVRITCGGLAAGSLRGGRTRCGKAERIREGEVERLCRSLMETEPTDLHKTFETSLDIVSKVASKSGSLKGTYVHALNCVVTAMGRLLEAFLQRTATEETAGLRSQLESLQALYACVQSENAELRAESVKLREEMAAMRVAIDGVRRQRGSSVSPPPPSQVQEAIVAEKDKEIEDLKRRLAILEARTSTVVRARPPLAHERPAQASLTPKTAAAPAPANATAAKLTTRSKTAGRRTPAQPERPQAAASAPPQPAKAGPGRSRNNPKGCVNAAQPAQHPQPRPLPPAPSNMDAAWTTVVKRGRRRAQDVPNPRPVPTVNAPQVVGRAATEGKRKGGRKARKPRAPRSAAVVLELLPAAKEKGLTYGEVMARARASVDVDAMGVEGGLRVRHTANGARLLECPGANTSAAADKLATRLREILPDPEVVRIDRPVKMAEVKVTGLDECATKEEVAAAIASQGNCALTQVRVGELRSSYSGAFTAWARCPMQAATLLATPPQGRPADSPGRLRVGWVMAHVQLQKARPWRCLRCFGTGHGLARCPSAVDRSGLCFRCGQPGHKAVSCTAAAPHCVLCDAAKRRADHRAGGPACLSAPSSTKRRRGGKKKKITEEEPAACKAAGQSVPTAAVGPQGGTEDEGAMDVTPQ